MAITTQAFAQSPPEFYSPDQSAFGRKMNEWSAQWWQSVISIPVSVNPLLDATGAYCMVGQQGPVWFLMGVGPIGGGTAIRTCTIPEGVALFFPIINLADINAPAFPPFLNETVSQLRAEIVGCMDGASKLTVTVDGVTNSPGPRQRVLSVPFVAVSPPDGLLPAGVYSPAVDDGYYVMLKPLPVGQRLVPRLLPPIHRLPR
jgi:hypothetical protein